MADIEGGSEAIHLPHRHPFFSPEELEEIRNLAEGISRGKATVKSDRFWETVAASRILKKRGYDESLMRVISQRDRKTGKVLDAMLIFGEKQRYRAIYPEVVANLRPLARKGFRLDRFLTDKLHQNLRNVRSPRPSAMPQSTKQQLQRR